MATHTVTLLPSGHQYLASEQQSILKAGLGAGHNLRYGCDGGNCGKCLTRLVKGDIHRLQHSDFVLGEEQKNADFFLSCCFYATSDLTLEVEEISDARQIPEQHISARVYRLEHLSDDVLSITFKTPRSSPLEFLAGQYVTIEFGNDLSRFKSLSSCPCDGHKPEIQVQRRYSDRFSEHVFNQLKKNDKVDLHGPWGDFTLDDDTKKPLVFIAFDTGFSAIKSQLEHVLALEKQQPIQLFWWVSSEVSGYQSNYCRAVSDAMDNFEYKIAELPGQGWDAIEKQVISMLTSIPCPQDAEYYITLPHKFRTTVLARLMAEGIPEQSVKIESLKRL